MIYGTQIQTCAKVLRHFKIICREHKSEEVRGILIIEPDNKYIPIMSSSTYWDQLLMNEQRNQHVNGHLTQEDKPQNLKSNQVKTTKRDNGWRWLTRCRVWAKPSIRRQKHWHILKGMASWLFVQYLSKSWTLIQSSDSLPMSIRRSFSKSRSLLHSLSKTSNPNALNKLSTIILWKCYD
jgi:hypothetical protein